MALAFVERVRRMLGDVRRQVFQTWGKIDLNMIFKSWLFRNQWQILDYVMYICVALVSQLAQHTTPDPLWPPTPPPAAGWYVRTTLRSMVANIECATLSMTTYRQALF